MTTTAREDRRTGPRAAAPDTAATVTPPPKLRRRPRWSSAAVVVDLLSAACSPPGPGPRRRTPRRCSLRATRIDRGEVIRPRTSNGSGSAPTRRSRRCRPRRTTTIVGQRAALDIAAGGLLTTESTTDEPLPPRGPVDRRDLADPGAGPRTRRCTAATRSGSSSRPAENGDAPAGTPQFTDAEVVGHRTSTRPRATRSSTSWCRTPTRACSPHGPRPATSLWSWTPGAE